MRMKFFTLFLCLLTFGALTITSCDKEQIVEDVQLKKSIKDMTEAELQAYLQSPEMTQTPEADKQTDPNWADAPVGESIGSEDKPMFEPAHVVEAKTEEGVFTRRSGTVQLGIDPLDFTPGPSGPTYVVQQYSFYGWFTIYVGDDDNVLFNVPAAYYPIVCNDKWYSYRVKAYDVTGCNEYEVVLSKVGCSGVIDRDYYSADDEDWIYFVAYTEDEASCGFTERAVRPGNCLAQANMCAFSN